ncbi:MAG: Gfo/Idh/MocA family oxidoreductase [Verrucomicrobia bacterium]|jgi:predicted dehydrogenase|nr:Gfo/Idh/MocA family oxidoreductase [Verrucomicrobiota bacterium]
MSKLKAAIIGSGLIANLKHIPAFQKHSAKVQLAAICDVNLEAARKVAAAHGIPAAYGNIAEMLAKEKPDIVDICTPPKTHAPIAIEAAKSGCNLLIEKPMAMSVGECDAIMAAAKEKNVKICLAHSDLFYYPFIEARKLVREGVIGEFRGMNIFLSTPTDYITSKADHWAHKLPGGVIGETGPHIVYMTLAFINPIGEVSVHAKKLLNYPWSRFEDYRIVLAGEKAISSTTLSYASNQWLARVEIIGQKAILLVDLEAMSLVVYRREKLRPAAIGMSVLRECKDLIGSLVKAGSRYSTRSLRTAQDFIIEGFADSILNGTPPPVPADEGRESVRVLGIIAKQLDEMSDNKPRNQ